MSAEDPIAIANPGYALGQLQRALRAATEHADATVRARAAEKIRRWEQVLSGMQSDALTVGSRTPVRDVPAWVTLEVAHGGFATGSLLAEGALQPHETAALARLGASSGAVPAGRERAALNRYYLGDEGLRELAERLADGRYRVQVPEEGALLTVTWLLSKGEAARALDLLDALAPFLDRLRFYPAPAERAPAASSVVHLQTVGEATRALEAVRPRPQIARMNEALRYWTPLYDRAVGLFLETVLGETPSLRVDAEGKLARRPDGQCVVEGGWPCQRYPEGWSARARALLDEYERLRATHRLSGKPDDPTENFARLRRHLATALSDPRALTGRDVGYVRKILASYVTAHGAPGSERLARTREAQARVASTPSHAEYRAVVIARLARHPGDAGLGSLDEVVAPLEADEAGRIGAAPGGAIPASVAAKVERCLEAPVEELVERGVIPSGEVLAIVLPQLTSQVRAADFADPAARRLHGAIYAAFRRRRSLLLLNLEHQVRFEELPWVAALEAMRGGGTDAKARARETLRQVSALAVASFPEAIVPNKLLQEMRALAATAKLDVPLVDELAADIFMGEFSEKFLRAAQVAARMLDGTLYARYYDVPCARVLAMNDLSKRWGTSVSPGFAALCQELAGAKGKPGYGSVARNGTVIEQEQVLTTHNLAPLFDALDLGAALRGRLGEVASRCFEWVCRSLQVKVDGRHARLIALKNGAYAWRQMLFFASLAEPAEREAFLARAEGHFAEQDEVFRAVFQPAYDGLVLVARGGRFDAEGRGGRGGAARRFLGWSEGRHWLA